MARKSSPTIQEELYPPPGEPEREIDDARLVDLDVEEQSPFLRGQKRVSARRGTLPKKTLHLLAWSALALTFAFPVIADRREEREPPSRPRNSGDSWMRR